MSRSFLRARLRAVSPFLAAVTLAAAAVPLFAAPAFAHAELISSSPEDGATLTKAPAQVVLTFGEPILSEGAGIVVTGPDGNRYDQSDTLQVGQTEASIELKPATTAGKYSVEYRIVAEDGHVGDGTLTYTLKGQQSSSTPAPSEVSAAPASSDAANDDGGSSTPWILGLGAIGIVLVVALVVAFARGRRA